MSNAKEKKKEWKRRLEEMDLISLLDYRDALLAQAVFYTVIKTEANKNSEMAAQQVGTIVVRRIVRRKHQFGGGSLLSVLKRNPGGRYLSSPQEFQLPPPPLPTSNFGTSLDILLDILL